MLEKHRKVRYNSSMELRVIKYFLAVAREESFVRAAESLYVTQPTLSRQIQEMEEELGKKLLVRGGRRITLTDEGMIFRKRAEEICSLVEMARNEVAESGGDVSGDVFIGAGEAAAVRHLAAAARRVQKKHPNVRFHISSGDGVDIADDLNRGLLDFALVFSPFDIGRYNFLELEHDTRWGLLMRRDNPLAEKTVIRNSDLKGVPLMVSRQFMRTPPDGWSERTLAELNVAGTYTLVFNSSLFVREGFACALMIDGILNLRGTDMVFVPLESQPDTKISVIWKKNQVMTKAAEAFLTALSEKQSAAL